jgi:death on curing protein
MNASRSDEPIWVTLDDVVAMHNRQLAEHGGGTGTRELSLLESALARPQFTWQYNETADIADLAAALAFGIITNHPFIDGNKRSGYVACRVFLILNGIDVDANTDDKYLTFYGVAAGAMAEAGLAAWVREHLVRA